MVTGFRGRFYRKYYSQIVWSRSRGAATQRGGDFSSTLPLLCQTHFLTPRPELKSNIYPIFNLTFFLSLVVAKAPFDTTNKLDT